MLQLEAGTREGVGDSGGTRQRGLLSPQNAALASKQGSFLQQVLAAHSSPPCQQRGRAG